MPGTGICGKSEARAQLAWDLCYLGIGNNYRGSLCFSPSLSILLCMQWTKGHLPIFWNQQMLGIFAGEIA